MHERLYLMWMGMYGIDPPATAALGDADDIRTFIAVSVQIDSVIGRLEDAIVSTDGYTPRDAAVKIARSWDGLDGEEDIRILREALEVLVRRAAALRVDVDG